MVSDACDESVQKTDPIDPVRLHCMETPQLILCQPVGCRRRFDISAQQASVFNIHRMIDELIK